MTVGVLASVTAAQVERPMTKPKPEAPPGPPEWWQILDQPAPGDVLGVFGGHFMIHTPVKLHTPVRADRMHDDHPRALDVAPRRSGLEGRSTSSWVRRR